MTQTTSELPEVGKILFASGDAARYTLHCSAVAYQRNYEDHDGLMILSVAGTSTAIKSLNAALLADAKARYTLDDIPGHSRHNPLKRPAGTKYRIRKAKLGALNTWHLLAVADTPGLIPNLTDDAIWRVLTSDEITTPVLRKWVPYVSQRLFANRQLVKLHAWGCSPVLLTADSDGIDAIVSQGLKEGEIGIS
ncbi:MAG: hypothetical protein H8E44_00155 [Planctomycetes bacterium]|nr:hypothetical protein [Planctomycetota bacterium]